MPDLSNIKIIPLLDTLRLEDISDDVYFSEKYSEYISNSRLKLIDPNDGGSPELYFEKRPKLYNDSLVFGSVIHQSVLQKDDFFIVTDIDRPTAKAGAIADIVYNKPEENWDKEIIKAAAEVDYYHGLLSENKFNKLKDNIVPYMQKRSSFEQSLQNESRIPMYLDAKSRDKMIACLASLEKNDKIQELLHPVGITGKPLISANEKTILLDVQVVIPEQEPFILRIKSKLDNYTIDNESNTIIVNDLKTTGKIVSEFNEAIIKYHYYRELGMYSWLLSLCANKFFNLTNPNIQGNFLVVSTIPEYYTKVVPMTKKLFTKGFNEFIYLLKLVAYYTCYGY